MNLIERCGACKGCKQLHVWYRRNLCELYKFHIFIPFIFKQRMGNYLRKEKADCLGDPKLLEILELDPHFFSWLKCEHVINQIQKEDIKVSKTT